MARVVLEKKQERIVRTLEGPLFVSAGAGSGKTFTLTQRVLYALTPGSKPREHWADPCVPEPFLDSIDQVLAITFTDKAAQELKQRIRAALTEQGLTDQAERVDNAWISTIHGMCSRIIRAHALDLGIDPAFSVVGYADDLKRLAVEHVVRRVAADSAQGGGVHAAVLDAFVLESAGGSTSIGDLVGILFALLAKVSATVGGFEAFRLVPPAASPIDCIEAYRVIAETPSYANVDEARQALMALTDFQASARDLPALRTCFAACGKLSKTARGMGKDEKAAVDAVRAARMAFFANAYLATKASALEELIPLARDVQREYNAIKRRQAVLDNDDLLTLAYDALASDPRVRAEFAGKFKMVMVDEFQDTAQQQVELVRLLCSPDGRELCTVGDAQQSIYRFRGADVSVFRAKKTEVEAEGVVCDLDVNYRSHADILSFADRIFEGGASNPLGRDFLHLVSCGEDRRGRARAVGEGTSRRQAVLVVGGTSDERAAAKAEEIARRFVRLRDEEGFCPGDMVILMARLSKADVYAQAVRAAGMPCVVSGGTSVFKRAPEVGVIGALLNVLANPDDGERGLAPLLSSPLFGLGAQELLALATRRDLETDTIDVRGVTGDVLAEGEVLSEFGELPLLERARTIMRTAFARVGRDRMSSIVRDVVHASGWLKRLEAGGPQEHAMAANVLKALAIVEEEECGRAYAPRLVAQAFAQHIENVKESPATLNGSDGDAVRIMTIHASKGLEFPVVAVAECDGITASSDRLQMGDRAGTVPWVVLPNRFMPASDRELLDELPPLDEDELASDQVPGRAAEAFAYLKHEAKCLDYEEAARLLYVAVTRAREVVILAMGAKYATELEPGHGTSLVGEVCARILPPDPALPDLPMLDATRLAFDNAHTGDYRLILLNDISYPKKKPNRAFAAAEHPAGEAMDDSVEDSGCAGGAPEPEQESRAASVAAEGEPDAAMSAGQAEEPAPQEPTRSFALVWPRVPTGVVVPAVPPARDSYSYTSLAAALHAADEDRVPAVRAQQDDAGLAADDELVATAPVSAVAAAGRPAQTRNDAAASTEPAGDPTALGSAFHALAQWLVECGANVLPPERIEAQCRYWGVTPSQRARLNAALARWMGSAVRVEALAWPLVRAEVPFFSLGMEELSEQFGRYAEGAIDLLCTDPARPDEALVIDYKTGGNPAETAEQLHEKHALQARVYADVLHKAGYAHVTLKFVRVEVEDADHPGEPQVVTYTL